jgi:hypothetical protein
VLFSVFRGRFLLFGSKGKAKVLIVLEGLGYLLLDSMILNRY